MIPAAASKHRFRRPVVPSSRRSVIRLGQPHDRPDRARPPRVRRPADPHRQARRADLQPDRRRHRAAPRRGSAVARGAVRPRARRPRRRPGHDLGRRRARRPHEPAGALAVRPHHRVADADRRDAGRHRRARLRRAGRRRALLHVRVDDGARDARVCRGRQGVRRARPAQPDRLHARRGRRHRARLRLVRRPGVVPEPARHDRRRDRALAPRRGEARPRADGRQHARVHARPALRSHRAAVGDAVAEHADGRHRARLSRHVPRRGHRAVRGARHDAAVRARGRAVARPVPARRRHARDGSAGARATAGDVPADVPQVRRRGRQRRPAARHRSPRVPAVSHRGRVLEGVPRPGARQVPMARARLRVRRHHPRDRSARGPAALREGIEAGASIDELAAPWARAEGTFRDSIEPYLLYQTS